ncbi:hypothetical protein DMI70_12465 [Escherichia coli]|nr:hypothetical protein [Escherichia coli]
MENAHFVQSGASKCWPDLFLREDYDSKMLLAAALSVTAMTAHADYQCSVTPRDDVIVSPQTVQVEGENGNLRSRQTAT